MCQHSDLVLVLEVLVRFYADVVWLQQVEDLVCETFHEVDTGQARLRLEKVLIEKLVISLLQLVVNLEVRLTARHIVGELLRVDLGLLGLLAVDTGRLVVVSHVEAEHELVGDLIHVGHVLLELGVIVLDRLSQLNLNQLVELFSA